MNGFVVASMPGGGIIMNIFEKLKLKWRALHNP
jgi:hypothetical protein